MRTAAAYSITRQLSVRLLVITLIVFGIISGGVYWATSSLHSRSQERILTLKVNKLAETSQNLSSARDDRFLNLLKSNAQKRPGTRLDILHADGSLFYRDPDEEPHLLSTHQKSRAFTLRGQDGSPPLKGLFTIDIEQDVSMLRSIIIVLILATVLGTTAVSVSAALAVRHGLSPLRDITRQTENISPNQVGSRLILHQPVTELEPWIVQFNSLMTRVEGSYQQLEAFNADVAHELRTPLTSLIGKTEIALIRSRRPDELIDVLQSNLEELHRISNLVNDMLFLSKADRSSSSRAGERIDLRTIIAQVLDFHEAALGERSLRAEIIGDATAVVDEPLIKRALSNLLSNATRFATPSSTVIVSIAQAADKVEISVRNVGSIIAPHHLPNLFNRFYRVDAARPESENHHGLGLAIVAAIARMHGGSTFAESGTNGTCIGFTIKKMSEESQLHATTSTTASTTPRAQVIKVIPALRKA
jgi:two-component system, OmpR family, heavy metal sensor histidine kinase CusS